MGIAVNRNSQTVNVTVENKGSNSYLISERNLERIFYLTNENSEEYFFNFREIILIESRNGSYQEGNAVYLRNGGKARISMDIDNLVDPKYFNLKKGKERFICLVNGKIVFPNDGRKYWFIPFDENNVPFLISGGDAQLTCTCTSGSGDCKIDTTSDGHGTTTSRCITDGCSGCCTGVYSSGGALLNIGGVFLAIDKVKFNGKIFQ